MAPPESPLPESADSNRLLTFEDVTDRVANGEALVIYSNRVYKLNSWMPRHPGGDLAIHHVLGKDATDEIHAMHPEIVYKKMIHQYYIADLAPRVPKTLPMRRKIVGVDDELEEDHDGYATLFQDNDRVRVAYQNLEKTLRAQGLFVCNYRYYYIELIRYITLITIAVLLVLKGTQTWHYLLSSVFLAGFWHQITFTAHDAGHNGITGQSRFDSVIGAVIASWAGGLSICWWKRSHNVHHIVPNSPEHDPDIQHLPFLAITTRFFKNITSTYYERVLEFDSFSKLLIPWQHYYYYIVLAFGRFNLYALSITFLLKNPNVRHRNFELAGMVFFWTWYSLLVSQIPTWPLRIAYILLSHTLTVSLHVQISLSHYGMSTEEFPNESFPRRQLRTTMDIECSPIFDWFHGGLQHQAIHHLFPRIPRHNLRRCVPHVRKFCDEIGAVYHIHGFVKGNGIVLGTLKEVSDQVKFIDEVVKHNAKTGVTECW